MRRYRPLGGVFHLLADEAMEHLLTNGMIHRHTEKLVKKIIKIKKKKKNETFFCFFFLSVEDLRLFAYCVMRINGLRTNHG